ncbi:UNVERIFIED_CONTAM: hypothetical protein RMT77_010324 [Armadillidium vulgare]
MPTCFALFCNHDSRRETCRMFQFPNNPDIRKQWLNKTRRTDLQLKSSSRICSCHFVKGKKHNGPTLFAWTNYISKIRRDLDNSTDVRNLSNRTDGSLPKESPIESNNSLPLLEVEVKTELVDGKTSEVENVETKPNISECAPISQTHYDDDGKIFSDTESCTYSVNTQEIDERVNNNHKLVNLRVENLIMAHEIEELEKKLQNTTDIESYQSERLTADKLAENEILLYYYTGLINFQVFKFLMYSITESESDLKYARWSVVNVQLPEQMLITLMKLRCNFGFSDIAYRFRVSSSTVKNIIWTFVDGLHNILYEREIEAKPLPYFINNGITLPQEFENFSNCRIILGYVEVEAEGSRVNNASDLKQRVLRGLVGVSPFGDFVYASDLYPENVTYKEIVQKSGLLQKLDPGDLILSTESLGIEDVLPVNVDLNVPLLSQNDVTMNEKKIMHDINIASRCLTRAVNKLRRYSILDRILFTYRMHASKIFQLCCALVNLENYVVEEG